jgi:hypothetical protein
VFLSQNRDSDCLTRCNFDVAYTRLQLVDESIQLETIEVVRETHWACGWVEWIAIHPSNVKAVVLAEEMARDLDAHPVLDEDRWSEMEREEADQNWSTDDVRQALRDAGCSEALIRNLPAMDRDDARFIRDEWLMNGADYEIRDEGGPGYYFADVGRDRAAWAVRWLRATE